MRGGGEINGKGEEEQRRNSSFFSFVVSKPPRLCSDYSIVSGKASFFFLTLKPEIANVLGPGKADDNEKKREK